MKRGGLNLRVVLTGDRLDDGHREAIALHLQRESLRPWNILTEALLYSRKKILSLQSSSIRPVCPLQGLLRLSCLLCFEIRFPWRAGVWASRTSPIFAMPKQWGHGGISFGHPARSHGSSPEGLQRLGDVPPYGMPAPLCFAISPYPGQGVQRPHQTRTRQQLVRKGRRKLAHHGSNAHERIGPDEQHQPGDRAGGPAGHPAHTGVQKVLVLAHHQNLRHRGKHTE